MIKAESGAFSLSAFSFNTLIIKYLSSLFQDGKKL
jgi:hypothetical protein